jgi:hypothetical protein
MRGIDVPLGPGDVDLGATEASRPAARLLRRQLAAAVPHGCLPAGPRAFAPVFGEIGVGHLRQEPEPCRLEVCAGLDEVRRGPAVPVTSVRYRKEPAPLPLVGVMRHAGAHADRADMDIVIEDVPALLAGFGIAAAGEDRNTHYRVNPKDAASFERAIDGEEVDTVWVDVPEDAVIHDPNRAGSALVWPLYGYPSITIRCFMPGTMT